MTQPLKPVVSVQQHAIASMMKDSLGGKLKPVGLKATLGLRWFRKKPGSIRLLEISNETDSKFCVINDCTGIH